MKKLLVIMALCIVATVAKAQDHDWTFGFYGDVQLKSPNHVGSFGIQGKYDFALHHGAQLLVNGRKDFVSVGADYVYNIFDKVENNFNIFLGVGFAQDFYRREVVSDNGETGIHRNEYDGYSLGIGQAGVSYLFPEVDMSIYAGYKLKYNITNEDTEPNFVMIGLRYHLW